MLPDAMSMNNDGGDGDGQHEVVNEGLADDAGGDSCCCPRWISKARGPDRARFGVRIPRWQGASEPVSAPLCSSPLTTYLGYSR